MKNYPEDKHRSSSVTEEISSSDAEAFDELTERSDEGTAELEVLCFEEASRPSLLHSLFLAVILTLAFMAATWIGHSLCSLTGADDSFGKLLSRGIMILGCTVIIGRSKVSGASAKRACVWQGILWAALLGASLQIAFAYVINRGAFSGSGAIGAGIDLTSTVSWAAVAVSSLLSPFAEELTFRRVIFVLIRQSSKGSWIWAGVFSSLLFSLVHSSLEMAVVAFCAGMFFAFVTESTGSFIPAVAAHASFNLVSFFMGYLPPLRYIPFAVSLAAAMAATVFFASTLYKNKSNEKDR